MRLKSLRKERPAFENEGAIINGSRMDLSNSGSKPSKHRTNNTFALPTSLNNEVTSLHLSPANYTPEINTHQPQHTLARRGFPLPTSTQPARESSYQAIEAAYLEHGIRIHLNSTAVAAVTQQQNSTTENLTKRKPPNIIQRHTAFANRNPSRSSSALHYPSVVHDTKQDSRPFSALHQTSAVDFGQVNIQQISLTQSNESQTQSLLSHQLNNNCSSISLVASDQSNHIPLLTQLAITDGTTPTTTVPNNDPDLAYMSSLLQTTSGDAFRDNIRRRAGLRATFAVHRHQPVSTTAITTPTSKSHEKSPVTQSPTTNHSNLLLRSSTVAVVPTVTTPSSKKIEKDILKHASRIRTNQNRDSLFHSHNSRRSRTSERLSSMSKSPTRIHHQNKLNTVFKPTRSISLEPLELLLASSPRPLPLPSTSRATSLSLHDSSTLNRNNHQENIRPSRKRTKSPKTSFVENNKNTSDGITTSFFLNEHLHSSILNDESLALMKNSPLSMITNDKTRESHSVDSGCYDRSSSSGDTRSITSLSIHQASSSLPSTRLISATTRRSNINKKVSFEDQSSTVIVTTATYV